MAALTAHSRMALQMLVALALAFAIGMPLLPQHWSWVVLSAFIVCSGAVSRGDALYKAVLRLGGAIGGTFAAAAVSRLSLGGPLEAALIFAALFLGLWLRERSYAYWAACATLIFALLQGSHGVDPLPLFTLRVVAISLGALCAVGATWFVFPLRTEHLIRRRVADARAALKGGAAKEELGRHLAQLDRVAPLARFKRMTVVEEMQGRLRTAIERPKMRVAISVAVSLDGFIDDRLAERLVLSSPEDLADMRADRETYDAVLVGAETVRRDNPTLRSAKGARVTITRSGDLDPNLHFFDGSDRTIVLAAPGRVDALRAQLGERAEVVAIERFDPSAIIARLNDLGVRSLFVEGGTRVLTAFLSSGTFDRLRLAIAPFFVGDTSAPRLVDAAVFLNDARRRLVLRSVRKLGDVAVLEYEHPGG
ncbi:MAG TPA: dihydrofolate reductase family protein [Candidatus Acidoferrales bacterium]|nr:dihydrofolate reductase family protein [Candidatus Acidoferrales bacterium]